MRLKPSLDDHRTRLRLGLACRPLGPDTRVSIPAFDKSVSTLKSDEKSRLTVRKHARQLFLIQSCEQSMYLSNEEASTIF
jgi:hypothetical protein